MNILRIFPSYRRLERENRRLGVLVNRLFMRVRREELHAENEKRLLSEEIAQMRQAHFVRTSEFPPVFVPGVPVGMNRHPVLPMELTDEVLIAEAVALNVVKRILSEEITE